MTANVAASPAAEGAVSAVTPENSADSWPNHGADIRVRITQLFGTDLDEEDRDLLTTLAASFSVRCDDLLDQLDRALDSADAVAVTQIGQSLRGSVANFGASNVAQLLAKVESDASCGELADAPALVLQVRSELGSFSARLRIIADELCR